METAEGFKSTEKNGFDLACCDLTLRFIKGMIKGLSVKVLPVKPKYIKAAKCWVDTVIQSQVHGLSVNCEKQSMYT